MKHLIIYMLCAFCLPLSAQRITRQYNNVSMADALKELNTLQSKYAVNFIYDDLEDFRVSTTVRGLSVPDAVSRIVGFYPIAVTQKGNVILVECTHKTQHHLTGRIIDEQGEAVPFANVLLLSPADSTVIAGGVSNESGVFVVPYETAKVIAKVSYVGYKTVCRLFTTEQAGTIRLQPETRTLQTVKVKAMRPQYKMAKGGMTVEVANTVLSKMGTAIDVLGQLPRVNVDGSGGVSIFAKGTPLIYINNKPLTDNRELTELKSDEIKSIDVITSPGAQYNASIQSVIKIVTLKRRNEGFSFRNDAYASYNSMWAGYESTKLTYRTNRLEITNSLYWSSDAYKEDNNLTNILHTQTNEQITIAQHAMNNGHEDEIFEKAGIAYAFNDSNSIGGSYQYFKSLYGRWNIYGKQDINRNGMTEGAVEQKGTFDRNAGPRNVVDIYYVGKIKKLKIDFNSSYMFTKSNEQNFLEETSVQVGDRQVHSYSNQRSRLYAAKLLFGYAIGKGELTWGGEISHTQSSGNYQNREQYVNDSETDIQENNVAGFVEYGMPMGHLNIDAGLRYEYVNSDYYSFGVKQDDVSREYHHFFPNVSLSWNKDHWGFQLSYNEKTHRPSYRSLRNFMQYDNRYLYEGGNPMLRPEQIHTLELSAVHRWISLSMGYKYAKNAIIWTLSRLDGQEIAYLTNRNYDHHQSVYASVSASPVFDWYKPMLEVDYQQQFFDAVKYGSSKNLNRPEFVFVWNNNLQINKTLLANISFRYRVNGYDGFQEDKGYSRLGVSLRKSFMKEKLIVLLRATDILNSEREKWTMYGLSAEGNKDCNNFYRSVSLTVTYNFNATRSKYKGTGAGNEEKKRL